MNRSKSKVGETTIKTAKKKHRIPNGQQSFLFFARRRKAIFGRYTCNPLLIARLGAALSSCSSMPTTRIKSITASPYLAENADIYAAEEYHRLYFISPIDKSQTLLYTIIRVVVLLKINWNYFYRHIITAIFAM